MEGVIVFLIPFLLFPPLIGGWENRESGNSPGVPESTQNGKSGKSGKAEVVNEFQLMVRV